MDEDKDIIQDKKRLILFRGKYKNGMWVYGDFLDDGFIIAKNANILQLSNGAHKVDEYVVEIKPETVGQYTGLKDKNGTTIFEGDIIRCDTYYEKPQLVKWNNEWCAFDPIFDARPVEVFPILSATNEIEVIGNIYDNPELLEAKDGNKQ